jgi:hypothetical protein
MACRDDGLTLQPIVPEQDRRCFGVVVGGGDRQVRQPGFPTVHAERGLRVRGRLRVPPAQPHITAGGALLVFESAVTRKPCLGTLQQDLGGIIGFGAFAGRRATPRLGEPVTRIEAACPWMSPITSKLFSIIPGHFPAFANSNQLNG